MKLPRIVLSLLAVAVLCAAVEAWLNIRGPAPGPDPASEASGRALLRSVIDAHSASALGDHGIVRFRVTCRSPFQPPLPVAVAVDPVSRSADFVVRRIDEPEDRRSARPSGGAEGAFRYNGATEAVTPAGDGTADPEIEKRLGAIAPSIVFWSLVPWILDDPRAILWRLPDGRRGGHAVRRLAVRWPGETDWFLLDVAAEAPRVLGIEFLDARATVFLRWRGDYNGAQGIDGVGFPEEWRFRPARPLLQLLTGGNDLFVFRYGPIL